MANREISFRPMKAGYVPPTTFRLQTAVKSLTVATASAYAPPIPESERTIVLDLSHHNGTLDAAKAKSVGVTGIYNKATESDWFRDPSFPINRVKVIEQKLPYGGYHFMRPERGASQAAFYLSYTDNEAEARFPHTADVEVAMAASVIRAYVDYFATRRNYYPKIYTSNYCWSLVTGATDKAWLVAHCGLWVAHWGTLSPMLPYGWTTYELHQFSANNNRRGAEFGLSGGDPDIDLNWARKAWVAKYAPPIPPPLPLPSDCTPEWRLSVEERFGKLGV